MLIPEDNVIAVRTEVPLESGLGHLERISGEGAVIAINIL